jgi:hypothetical protein
MPVVCRSPRWTTRPGPKSLRDTTNDRRDSGCVIHSRIGHHHPGMLFVLDVSLVAIVTLLTIWAMFVLIVLVVGATTAGA